MKELLDLLRENNQMLKEILSYLRHEAQHDDTQDFFSNVIANIVADKMMGGHKYVQKSY